MRRSLVLAAIVLASPVLAQEDDRDYLTAFLEDSLSDLGREVTITGFAGALSSRATIETLTIADDQGIWLTVSGVTLDWSRSALLSGSIEVSELSASRIELLRTPQGQETSIPAPEAGSFQLPDLPVSITIDRLSADQIVLGETVLGQPVEGRLDAEMQLAGGAGQARLELQRTDDGPDGGFVLGAAFDNASQVLSIDLSAGEGAGGIVASALDIPGTPAAALTVAGSGPLADFRADMRLQTDGVDRLAGAVTLRETPGGDMQLLADVAGNLAPLLLPDHVGFFGDRVALTLDATRTALGSMRVDRLGVETRSLTVEGRLTLAADGLPEDVTLTGTIAAPDGSAVLMPFGDQPTRIGSARFDLALQQGDGAGWRADVAVDRLVRDDLALDRLTLAGSGRIGRTAAGNSLGGTLGFLAEGLAPADPALAAALGPAVEGGLKLHHLEGSGALRLSDLRFVAEGLAASGALRIEGLDSALLTSGELRLSTPDLSRFSRLAGRPLGGSGDLVLKGSASALTGFLDAEARLEGNALSVGVAELDRLLAGQSQLDLSLLRDETGTTLRRLDISAGLLGLSASGKVASEGSDLTGRIALPDLAALGPGYGGSLDVQATFLGTPQDGSLALAGSAANLRANLPGLEPLLAGATRLAVELQLSEGRVLLSSADLTNPQLTLNAAGQATGTTRGLTLEARLANLGLLVPNLSGPLTIRGQAIEEGDSYRLDIGGQGPGQVDGRVTGRIDTARATADLTIAGSGQAVLANLFIAPRAVEGPVRYDLRLNGPLRLSSLSGRITLAGGRLTDPDLGLALEGIEALADLSGGEARISATAGLSSGGRLRVDGPVGLSAPFSGQLTVALDAIRLYDPELYDATLSGRLSVAGPLTGGASISGALALARAELQVPSSGFDTAGALLNIRHRNEPAAVRDTRAKAGLLDQGGGTFGAPGGARPFGLDVTLAAPGQIFVRGRGIDAELGGQVRLLGTTAEILPAGGFSLIRGRLDILGKRLVLSRAELALEGSFVPMLEVAAFTESDGIVSTVTIDGPADNPAVTFSSVPDLPQEEVLARLLFGRGLDSLSALQAAQLANAVAVLAGRGGEGLVSLLRKSFGLDDLDLATADDGSTALTAGKYLSENLYTEVEIEQGGKARVNLNLDLRPGVTVRAGVGDDGETGLGVFLEKDY